MPNEQAVVDSGENRVAQEGNTGVEAQAGQASAEANSSPIDPQEYSRMQTEYQQLHGAWSKIEQLTQTNPEFKRVLELAWRGQPITAAQPQVQQKQKAQGNEELNAIKEQMRQIQEQFQSREQAVLRAEKQTEVSNEVNDIQKAFNASSSDMKEFWNRYDQMIKQETFAGINRGLDPNAAAAEAYRRHGYNLKSEYVSLMEDKMTEFYGSRLAERNNPLRGIQSGADRVGKPGSLPTSMERFQSALKNEKDPGKRAELYAAFAQERGVSVDELFRGTR